ncbi:hypothetical protein EDD91_7444 [Streptomyces sp. KS 21]|nr:hypothetical protein EDD91_7444 [Streptomyces sp. KS 21]
MITASDATRRPPISETQSGTFSPHPLTRPVQSRASASVSTLSPNT